MPELGQFLDPDLTRHWRYYLILEGDLETALRFVEPHKDNAQTFSLEFARLILATCAQFELVLKLLCERRSPESKVGNIRSMREVILKTSPGFIGWRTRFFPLNEVIAPFASWTETSRPGWWAAYNQLKHQPASHIRHATLENAIGALAATGLVTIAFLQVNAQPGTSHLFDLQY